MGKYEDSIDQMVHIDKELEVLLRNAKHLYYKSLQIQESAPKESEILFSSACVNFYYMVIRFCAFYGAFDHGIIKTLEANKRLEIEALFSDVELEKKLELRNIVLAHNYNKKTKHGYESVLVAFQKGEYNILYSPTDFKYMKTTSALVLDSLGIQSSPLS